MTSDPRLIRIVTSQYQELQGLKTILNAALPLAYAALMTLADSTWHVLVALPLVLAGFWFRFAVSLSLARAGAHRPRRRLRAREADDD